MSRTVEFTLEPEFALEQFNDLILPAQYNHTNRNRRSLTEGEYRLLWAVLENAIRTYLTNRRCPNLIQRKRFEEVRNWFELTREEQRSPFGFQNICDLIGIDSDRLLRGLKSVDTDELPFRHREGRHEQLRP
ncbi:MAG TPA: hypothetical protein VMF50_15695 [Candidatus Binataceae bacterium]|nr:hypothetical protein [Candidatus Binataceae bacterium]